MEGEEKTPFRRCLGKMKVVRIATAASWRAKDSKVDRR